MRYLWPEAGTRQPLLACRHYVYNPKQTSSLTRQWRAVAPRRLRWRYYKRPKNERCCFQQTQHDQDEIADASEKRYPAWTMLIALLSGGAHLGAEDLHEFVHELLGVFAVSRHDRLLPDATAHMASGGGSLANQNNRAHHRPPRSPPRCRSWRSEGRYNPQTLGGRYIERASMSRPVYGAPASTRLAAARCAAPSSGDGARPRRRTPRTASASRPCTAAVGRRGASSGGSSSTIVRAQRR